MGTQFVEKYQWSLPFFDCEKDFEADFLDKLSTPDDLKDFSIEDSFAIAQAMDFQHVSCIKEEKKRPRLQVGNSIVNTETLVTPVVDDPNLPPSAPLFGSNVDVGEYLPPDISSDYQPQIETPSASTSSISRFPVESTSSVSHHSGQYGLPHFGSLATMEQSYSPFTSSNTYTELKPRPFSSPLVPTVVEDHPYHVRNTSSPSHSFSAPSPSPSTRSMASSPNLDVGESSRYCASSDNEDGSRNKRKKNVSASKKCRLTKREKLQKMIEEADQLQAQNDALKREVDYLQGQVSHFRDYVVNIMYQAGRSGVVHLNMSTSDINLSSGHNNSNNNA